MDDGTEVRQSDVIEPMEETPVHPDELQTAIITNLEDIKNEIITLRLEQWGDFRWTIGGIIGATAAIIGVMAYGFHWL